ncbi:Carbon catabolite repressor protein 4 homolog 6 [Linum perenne]
MKRSAAPPLQFLAAIAAGDTTAMSSRIPHRGGRRPWGRGFSGRHYSGGRGPQFIPGDSHHPAVQEPNLGFTQGGPGSSNPWRPPPPPSYLHSHTQEFQQPRPHYYQNQHQFRQPPPFVQNQYHQQFQQAPAFDRNQGFRPPNRPVQQLPPRQPKELIFRNWEYANVPPPPNADRFSVLSYNILADYLAINHRSKLYFHIPHHMLSWQWRKRSIIFELGLWKTDILCFQEVDRFQELEDDLRPSGYSGIYQMRTGSATDGCAIFWRTSKFNLVHEESIVFNKIGLRDNVAQICVLELISLRTNSDASPLPASAAGSNKVVVCNIHVLYNPRRGEIKIGQVRNLLDRAHAVSKLWNDAPVVLCGDFNCTPKSPLYNFISEQKLDLSEVDRDKVSGQASAEIRPPRTHFYGSNPNFSSNPRAHSPSNSGQAQFTVDSKLDTRSSDFLKNNHERVGESSPSSNVSSNEPRSSVILDSNGPSSAVEGEDGQHNLILNCEDRMGSANPLVEDTSMESSSTLHDEDERLSDRKREQQEESDAVSNTRTFQSSESSTSIGDTCRNLKDLSISHEVSCSGSRGFHSLRPNINTEDFSTAGHEVLSASTNRDHGEDGVDGEFPQLFRKNDPELEITDEDESSFVAALHGTNDTFSQTASADMDQSRNEFDLDPNDSQVHLPTDKLNNDSSQSQDFEVVDENTIYDPSVWTPTEIATATGDADCICLQHPLTLRSAYAVIEDRSGTRDSHGEPEATSYNRHFLGTVDYIWFSKGLQPVGVLAPIPKRAMQWTSGFPTKKWGSDHIALASEFAFTPSKNPEVDPSHAQA